MPYVRYQFKQKAKYHPSSLQANSILISSISLRKSNISIEPYSWIKQPPFKHAFSAVHTTQYSACRQIVNPLPTHHQKRTPCRHDQSLRWHPPRHFFDRCFHRNDKNQLPATTTTTTTTPPLHQQIRRSGSCSRQRRFTTGRCIDRTGAI